MTKMERQNFGEFFRGILETKGLNLGKLSELTGVPVRFLENLVNENYEGLPPAPYIRGYLLKIAEVLNADGQEIWQSFQKDNEEIKRSGGADHLPKNRFEMKKINQRVVLAGIVTLLFLSYLTFRADDFLGRPALYLATPSIDAVVDEPSIKLEGQVEPKDALKINGEDVFADENGYFRQDFTLQPGINNIEFKVKRSLETITETTAGAAFSTALITASS